MFTFCNSILSWAFLGLIFHIQAYFHTTAVTGCLQPFPYACLKMCGILHLPKKLWHPHLPKKVGHPADTGCGVGRGDIINVNIFTQDGCNPM